MLGPARSSCAFEFLNPLRRGCRRHFEDIHFCLQAFAETQIIGANLEPTLRSLIKIQAPPDFDDPAIIQPDLSVVELRIQPDI
jgi:hypothetical protein